MICSGNFPLYIYMMASDHIAMEYYEARQKADLGGTVPPWGPY